MSTAGGAVTELDRLGRQWSEALAEWAIPDDIVAAAPEPPWGFSPELFTDAAAAALGETVDNPSFLRAREALIDGGSVLDVGSGAGAASLPLVPPATELTAVDESEAMLAAFDRLATERDVAHETVRGRWPDIARQVPPADVVVCHHVAYNVADIVPFLRQLDGHARRRVVIELTETHPLSDLSAAFRLFHGIERPTRPVAEDLIAILRAMAVDVGVERFTRLWSPSRARGPKRVALARRRLCVGPERDEEIACLLPAGDRTLVSVWWDAGI